MGEANLSRRAFLERGALATLTLSGLAACGTAVTRHTPPPSKPTPPATPPPTPPPTGGPPTPAEWSALENSLSGHVVLPADNGYNAARLVYDLRYTTAQPQAVAFANSPTDVQRLLDFARTHEIQPIPRCGGHSYGGYSTGNGLIIDVTPMNAVSVGATGSGATPTASVGAGARLIDLYAGTAASGVLVPGGSCASVGISGLALGGGIGVVGRRYGLTCDAIQSLTAVTADSRLLNVSPTADADLLWASQGGGGGNFAIVTGFNFTTYPIPPMTLFGLHFPWAAAADVLGAWQAWVSDAPDELWSNCMLLSSGAAGLSARIGGVYTGAPAALAPLTARLLTAVGSQPTTQFATPNSYLQTMLIEAGCSDITVAQCHLPTVNPAGTLPRSAFLAKSAYFSTAFPQAGLAAATDAITDLQHELPAIGGGLAFDSYGGAINAIAPDATAFVHRNALCQLQLSAALPDPIDPSTLTAVQSWLAQTATALAPFSDGEAYQNYIDPTLTDWQQAYYGANLPRLVAVKQTYDPDNVFHSAQSIPTSL
jgi:FAD/FMN-containing dehydrogenase